VRSAIGIDVAAPAELVFRLARDVERWPDLLPHYVRADAVAPPDPAGRRLVRFVARRPLVPLLGLGLPVVWRSLTWSEPETLRLRFLHRGGATNGMDVTWRIDGWPGAPTHVEIEHEFRPRMPGWAWFIDRVFTRAVAGRTLASFRSIAEALAADGEGAAQSDPALPANPWP
jgi:hypothetical protein